ncbi:MAG: 1,6-anhydro-N-acetylmuramyl-L-alanine amidase AmpD, partial [Rhodocyclaceae bacterium]|nr:1,6-anhydro-N-acetylmuramyl-L-alanine amidase AmpD [Rhodocyclaceae bacterium]
CNAHPYFAQLRELHVSAHLFIRRDGEVVQFAPFAARAWHAGVSRWRGRERCNDFSVGIELEGSDLQPFTDVQYQRLAQCLAELVTRLPIVDIAAHADIAPGRKTDPGPHFDWARLQRELAAHLGQARAADLLAARRACA